VWIDLGNCEIRPFVPEDAESLARNADNPNIADQLRDRFPNPYTVADAREWIEQSLAAEPVTSFAVAAPAEVIGGIGLQLQSDVHVRTAELGYWIAEPYWGRGIATRAVSCFSREAFEAFDLIRIYARVFETNPASARVLEKAGFRLEGRLRMSVVKKGRMLDELLYSSIAPGRD
jgi:RimJ/RimL family protein N-acetyltransferase